MTGGLPKCGVGIVGTLMDGPRGRDDTSFPALVPAVTERRMLCEAPQRKEFRWLAGCLGATPSLARQRPHRPGQKSGGRRAAEAIDTSITSRHGSRLV